MLIRFDLENWTSFRDCSSFSMVASREKQHGARVPRLDRLRLGILPVAAIYGGNASGKTNLFKALAFARDLVVRGSAPDSAIAAEPFRLDKACLERPTRFLFELLVDEEVYAFSFAVTREAVLEEKLVRVRPRSEEVLYNRIGTEPHFAPSLAKDQFLRFAFQGTRDNQLFLTNSVTQKIETFRPLYDWFADRLELVAPDSRFQPFERFIDPSHPVGRGFSTLLRELDTGISTLDGREVAVEDAPLPEVLLRRVREETKEGETVRLLAPSSAERYLITKEKGELKARKLVSQHTGAGGRAVEFELRHESDGSQRLIDLLPAFIELAAPESNSVYVIDELDRSLHTQLTRQLLQSYLAACSHASRAQLLFTTHDVLLMDQALLRRDEMWVSERSRDGASTLIAFSEYKDVRNDKDIRKSYLQGRLGGVPRFPADNLFANTREGAEA